MLPSANPSVICQRVDDGAVLFAPHSETYFGLNAVGVAIWEALPPVTATLDELCARIGRLYPDAPAATIRGDVVELLEQLMADGLALHGTAARPDAGPAA
jgi:hypothetical protein